MSALLQVEDLETAYGASQVLFGLDLAIRAGEMATLLGLEDLIANHRVDWLAAIFPNYQQHASLGVGAALLAIVLFAPQGIAGMLARKNACSS